MSKYKVLSDLRYKSEVTKAGTFIEEDGPAFEQLVKDGVLAHADGEETVTTEETKEEKPQNTFGPTLPQVVTQDTPEGIPATVPVGTLPQDDVLVGDVPPVDGVNL